MLQRTILLWPAFVFTGNSRWNVLHLSKTNGTYLNQEYFVRGKRSTFKYICLFADFCDLFGLPQQDENCGNSCLTIFSYWGKIQRLRRAFPSICTFVREKHGWKSIVLCKISNRHACMIKGVFLSVNPKTVLDPKTDFAFLSANPNPDFWSGESFLKKDPLDLKSEESKSRLTD